VKRASIVLIAVVICSCGGSSPTGPTGQKVADAAGVWAYTSRVSTVSGGECVGAALQAAVGSSSTGTIQINQSGGSVTATTTDDSDGSSCSYSGTAGANSLALNATSCTIGEITGIVCLNGARRDMRIQTSGINATLNGTSANGTAAETWNVFVAGTGSAVGPLTMNSSFSASRR
jgi:hypothetical protein